MDLGAGLPSLKILEVVAFEIPAAMRQSRTNERLAVERGEELVGKALAVYNAPEQLWRRATVARWLPSPSDSRADSKHGLLYEGLTEDIDIEWLNLDFESYRVDGDIEDYTIASRQLFWKPIANLLNQSIGGTGTLRPSVSFNGLVPGVGGVEYSQAQQVVEEVLGTRTFQGSRECYVKWKNISYLRAGWVSEERVKLDGKYALQKIKKRILVDQEHRVVPWATVPARDADRRPETVAEDCLAVERILSHRIDQSSPRAALPAAVSDTAAAVAPSPPAASGAVSSPPAPPTSSATASPPVSDGTPAGLPAPPAAASTIATASSAEAEAAESDARQYEYLVKWRGLNYSECAHSSMELADAIKDDEAIQRYHANEKKYEGSPYLNRTPTERFSSQRFGQGGFQRMDGAALLGEQEGEGGRELRDYQVEGINWLRERWWRQQSCILADEMGLGKTIQSSVFLNSVAKALTQADQHPFFLIVVPLSTLANWYRELAQWTDLDVVIYKGDKTDRAALQQYEFRQVTHKSQRRWCPKFDCLLTTPTMLSKDTSFFQKFEFDVSSRQAISC